MNGEIDLERELQSQGLSPKTWPMVLESLKAGLPAADWEKFSRLHGNFTGYRSENTSSRFYGFVFSRGLHLDVNNFRYARLMSILKDLLPEIPPGISILDVGAGAGIIASIVRRHCAPRSLVLQDPCREVRDALSARGFAVLPHPAPAAPEGKEGGFDLLLCIDSLGEINSDDDGALAKPGDTAPGELAEMLEERYGFTQKLRPWKPYLAPGGRVLLWEPFAYQTAMESLALSLREGGWNVNLHSRAPGRNYLELRPN
ncbi:MAG TPA: methyltransferase domain-containing protein [Fibrobacteria bacterium]|nr:methyltransferase domain-containing protein [Fibrobacteria bacterium]